MQIPDFRFHSSVGVVVLVCLFQVCAPIHAESLTLHTRSRVKVDGSTDEFRIVYKTVRWEASQTAIIICDMWDTMKCKIPADRISEMAPYMNETISRARERGVLIIHAPSGTMDYYKDTPQRKLCLNAPEVETDVPLRWNSLNPEREPPLPIDDSDNGWEGPLLPGPPPQTHEHDALEIKPGDAIGDGPDVYYLLEQRGIKNVILVGVHTNMCVLGRPFGIRQMVYLGKKVLLMRDMTDCLYNPEMPPYVTHFRGKEMVVEHIEKYWCPTITSTDFTGKPSFHFKEDARPYVVFIVSDDHYQADEILPRFAQELREREGLRCTVLHGEGKPDIPNLVELDAADSVVLYIRRLGLPTEQLDAIRGYLDSGNPLVALRTACHAFAIHFKPPADFKVPEGHAEWRSFDADVLGCHYHGHTANELGTDVSIVKENAEHPILAGVEPGNWHSTGSLYLVSPVDPSATVLMIGSVPNQSEPITWVRTYRGGRIFFTSLGHPDDFKVQGFRRLLINAIRWSMGT